MYIYVLRHGLTDWNIQRKLLSVTDVDLNDIGIEQCEAAKKLVENLGYDFVFCSPKLRTKHTAQIVNVQNKPIIYDKRLIERDAKSIEGINVDDFDYRAYWTLGKDEYKDSETNEEYKKRVYEFLDELKKEYEKKNILIVTHNGICRIINTYFNGFPKRGDIFDIGQKNAQLKMYNLK